MALWVWIGIAQVVLAVGAVRVARSFLELARCVDERD